ncbi:MAG: hypothetical protein ACFFEF_04265, partial [Candidatus Thorarchaeota archaeon]
NTYDISLEAISPGTNITFFVSVDTIYGDTFELSQQLINLPSGGANGPGLTIDPMLLVAIGGIGAVALVLIVIFMKKRGN